MSAALTVRMEDSLLARLDALAAERGTTREQVVQAALTEHLSMAEGNSPSLADWQLALVDEGLAAADRGDFASANEVEAVFSKYRA